MCCYKLAKKAFLYGTSLAVITLISTKLVLACQSVTCNNGIKSNICSIENNEMTAYRYFIYSLILTFLAFIIYFARKQKGFISLAFCFIAAFFPPILRYSRGNGSCDFFATDVAIWLFYASLVSLIYQITSWIFEIKKFKTKLR